MKEPQLNYFRCLLTKKKNIVCPLSNHHLTYLIIEAISSGGCGCLVYLFRKLESVRILISVIWSDLFTWLALILSLVICYAALLKYKTEHSMKAKLFSVQIIVTTSFFHFAQVKLSTWRKAKLTGRESGFNRLCNYAAYASSEFCTKWAFVNSNFHRYPWVNESILRSSFFCSILHEPLSLRYSRWLWKLKHASV